MLDGVILLWFILTGLSTLFVAIDIWRTPEANALRWGFIVLTIFAGPFAAFFYVLGCREPFPGAHEQYVAPVWKQVLGSTMHCASGDGLGIITGAAIGSILTLPFILDISLEYILGFGFGWLFFQAFAMKDMAGGNYLKSLRMTFIPEFLSMNLLMAGMIIVSRFWMPEVEGSEHPSSPAFWFIMSMALVGGFLFAYPMNWWLVTKGLKHGMMTVRRGSMEKHTGHDMDSMNNPDQHSDSSQRGMDAHHGHANHDQKKASTGSIVIAGALSLAALGGAIVIVLLSNPVHS